MTRKFNGDRTKFTKEDLRTFDDIANLDIDYCTCYSGRKHPDFGFCDQCGKAVLGTDESIIKTLITITAQYHLLKSK